jgi:hypothetical protein
MDGSIAFNYHRQVKDCVEVGFPDLETLTLKYDHFQLILQLTSCFILLRNLNILTL